MLPTMDAVAQRAGVAKSTVSLVLNDKPGVTEDMRHAVLTAAGELGYRLPPRRPRKSLSNTIEFTVVHYVGLEPYSEPYGLSLRELNGIRSFARRANVNLTFIAGYRRGDIARLGAHFLEPENTPPNGMILMGPGLDRDSQLLQSCMDASIPVVVMSRRWPDLLISSVGQDYRRQTGRAIEHLLELGHRKIAFVASKRDQSYNWFEPRLSCYREIMTREHILEERLVVSGSNGGNAAKRLLAENPDVTAIFAVHDRIALEAMIEIEEMGLRIPEDISIIGQDDSEEIPEGLPSLTTVGFDQFEVGYLAAELLGKQIENPNIVCARIRVRNTLIARGSTASPRSESR